MLVFHKKKTLLQIEKFLHGKVFYLIKIDLRKFKKDGLKTVEEDRYYIYIYSAYSLIWTH